jgi:hypothetical protein
MASKINLAQKFSLFGEHRRPKVVARVNGQEVKLVKAKGEFHATFIAPSGVII